MDTAEDFEQKRKTVAGEKKKKADKNWLQHWRHNIEIKARSCLKDVGKSAIISTETVSESLNDSFSNQFYQLITESEDLFNNVIKLQIYQAFN